MAGLFLRASKSVATGRRVFSKIQVPLTLSGRRSMALQLSQWLMVSRVNYICRSCCLDFTQNLEEATDAITLGRRHSWLESEGFSLSAANADVQELPATPYH